MPSAPVKLIVVSELGTVDPTVTTAVVERAEEIRWLGAYDFRRELPTAGVDLVLIDVDHGLEDAADLAVRLASPAAPSGAGATGPGSPPNEPPPPAAETPTTDPRPRVAFLATTLSSRIRATARTCGVEALMAKSLTVDELTTALVSAAGGRRVDAPGRAASATSWPGQAEGLTQREGEVLELCAAGFTNREIADRLYLNVETVKSHLKRVYQRIGLRNRAEAAAFVHRQRTRRAPGFADGPSYTGPGGRLPPGDLSDELGLTIEALADRRHLLGLSNEASERLIPFTDAVDMGTDAFVAHLIERWLACEHTAYLLYDEAAIGRLTEHQRRYIPDLFRAAPSDSEIGAMLRTGAVHHRLGLTPQWYLASYVHVVCDHLPLVFDLSPSPLVAVEAACALLARVLLDASIGLDAFDLSVERELLATAPHPPRNPGPPASPAPAAAPPGTGQPERNRTVTRITVISDEAQVRRSFLGIDDAVTDTLHRLAPAVDRATPAMLDEFYDVLRQVPALAELVPPDVVPRLLTIVADHWHHLIRSDLDRTQAEACVAAGLGHERIGLAPQLYLIGLARQVSSLLRGLAAQTAEDPATIGPADLLPATDALIRAAFFDLTFVLDAYLDARIDTLLDGQRFANQIVANLATGVAVVDSRGRLEYVNEQLLAYVRQPTRALRRLPLEHAFDLEGLNDLVGAARASISGRASTMTSHRDRRLRVTAACLHRTVTGDPGPVAIIVDDLTEVVRAGAGVELDDRHLMNVLAAVSSIAWEVDQETLVMVAMSRTLESLTGHRDIDLLGGDGWPAVLDVGDAAEPATAVTDRLRSLAPGGRAEVEHKLSTVDGRLVAARSSLVAGTGETGRPTVFGVTVAIAERDSSA